MTSVWDLFKVPGVVQGLPSGIQSVLGSGQSAKKAAQNKTKGSSKITVWDLINPLGTGPSPMPPSVTGPIAATRAILNGIGGPRPSPLASPRGGGYNGSTNAFTSTNDRYGDMNRGAGGSSSSSSSNSAFPDIKYDPFVDPYAKFNPEQMAAREFNPQYALLDQMANQTTTNYNRASGDITNAWNLLSKDISGKAAGIKGNYDKMGKDITSGWGNVAANTTSEFDRAKASLIENAQRSGTMDQVGKLIEKLAASQMDINATTGARGQNWAGFNQQMGQNALEENRLGAEAAQWGGINAKADFAARLQNALADISNKRLETKANQGAAVNKYGLDIAQMTESAREAWNTLQTQRAQQAIDFATSQSDAAAKAAEAAAKGQKDVDTTKLTPTEYLAYLAQIQYPNVGADTRQRAVQAIQDTFSIGAKGQDRAWANAAEFVQDVLARNPNAVKSAGGDARQLAQMAQDYYAKIAGGANKPYGQRT